MREMFEQRLQNKIYIMNGYGFVLIIISIFLVQFAVLSSSHFVCNSNKCKVSKKALFNMIKCSSNIDLYKI